LENQRSLFFFISTNNKQNKTNQRLFVFNQRKQEKASKPARGERANANQVNKTSKPASQKINASTRNKQINSQPKIKSNQIKPSQEEKPKTKKKGVQKDNNNNNKGHDHHHHHSTDSSRIRTSHTHSQKRDSLREGREKKEEEMERKERGWN
jgi:hypothetical protein